MLYGAYEGPKVFWLWGGGFFLTIFWIIQLLRGKQFLFSGSILIYTLWIVVLFVSSVFGIHPISSLIGGSYRHQGILFFFTLFLLYQTKEILPILWKKRLITWISIPVIIESSIVIAEKLYRFSSRPLGTIGEPNAIAGFLAFGLYFVYGNKKLNIWIRWGICLLVIIAIICTGSRTGIVSAFIVLSGSIYTFWKTVTRQKYTYIIGSSIVLLGIFTGFFVWQINTTRPYSQYENRLLYRNLALQEIIKNPIIGYGAESGEQVFGNAYSAQNIRIFDTMVDRSHNIFLDVLLWSGFVGLSVFVYWIWSIGKRLIMTKDFVRFAAFIAWFIFASFQPVGVIHWVSLLLIM